MIIHQLKKILLCLFITISVSPYIQSQQETYHTIAGQPDLEKDFVSPPETVQTAVYWHWVNGNISKEGIVKDLYAMKQAGINRAFITDIGLTPKECPMGETELFSEEWWDIVHTTLKTATELNVELGFFISPGWSQAGGPWNKPEQAMRYLASSEIKVKGPRKLVQKLDKPAESFQDVKVVAWPVPGNYKENLLNSAQIQLSPEQPDICLTDDTSVLKLNQQEETVIDIHFRQASTARSLLIYPAKQRIHTECELQVKEGNNYRMLSKFEIDRTNPQVNVGFEPYAPVAVSFPETKSGDFRIIFSPSKFKAGIERIVLSSTPIVEDYAGKTFAKMFQTPLPYWHDYLWPQQPAIDDKSLIPSVDQVRDLSANLSTDGTLTWDVPAGEWIIMRTGMAPTGSINAPASPLGTGLEVDKMSKEHLAAHFDAYLGEIIRRIPAEDRKTWKVIVQDSYETGGQNITDGFLEEFQQRYGYDPIPFLPVYKGHVIGSPDLSDRFLWDMRRLVADKVSYDYVGALREIGKKYGMTTWLENYGHWGYPGEFLQYGGQSDEVAGEFWSEGNLGDIENRAASSCAHIYGKTKVWSESYTSSGNAYGRHPAALKRRGDWSYTEGINATLLHLYIHQAYEDRQPGIDAWYGVEFNRHNTWYPHLDLFTDYLKRTNYMLQQGLDVADVAYFIGEDAPKMTGVREPEIPKGYSYDYMNAEVILRDLSVKDGRLVLPHGTSYRILVLPPLETMRPEVLQKIEQLVVDGAVIMGPPPNRSPSMEGYPKADEKVKTLASKMWGDLSVKQRTYGQGTILTGMTMEEAFALLKVVPDCLFAANDPVLYTHRKLGEVEIYFITNQSEQMIRIEPKFRVQDKQPELWDAITGSVRLLPAFMQSGEITSVPLQLEANGSAFIVFRKTGKPTVSGWDGNYPAFETVITFDRPWIVTFGSDEIKRGPVQSVIFEELLDWTQHSNESIRYYSGTATYKTSFTCKENPAGKDFFLDLGKISCMAKVKLNGHYAGGVWTAPYRLDVTQWLKEGENMLEVEVVNTWVNRLIGDQNLPEGGRRTWAHNNPWKADSPLQSSGLIGPVTLKSIKDQ